MAASDDATPRPAFCSYPGQTSYSMIGSVALMLDMSFGMTEEAKAVWQAMQKVFEAGFSTGDLSSPGSASTLLSTTEFGDKVLESLEDLL